MDGQTDVGHINLIGRLVTRNPPKNTLHTPSIICDKNLVNNSQVRYNYTFKYQKVRRGLGEITYERQ